VAKPPANTPKSSFSCFAGLSDFEKAISPGQYTLEKRLAKSYDITRLKTNVDGTALAKYHPL